VHVSSMTDDYYRFDEKGHLLQGENTKKAYRLGDRVEVQVARVDLERRQIDFALVDVLARARGAGGRGRPPGRSIERSPGPPPRAAAGAPGRRGPRGSRGPSRGRKRR
jgi:ribonuclease R